MLYCVADERVIRLLLTRTKFPKTETALFFRTEYRQHNSVSASPTSCRVKPSSVHSLGSTAFLLVGWRGLFLVPWRHASTQTQSTRDNTQHRRFACASNKI